MKLGEPQSWAATPSPDQALVPFFTSHFLGHFDASGGSYWVPGTLWALSLPCTLSAVTSPPHHTQPSMIHRDQSFVIRGRVSTPPKASAWDARTCVSDVKFFSHTPCTWQGSCMPPCDLSRFGFPAFCSKRVVWTLLQKLVTKYPRRGGFHRSPLLIIQKVRCSGPREPGR